MSLSVTLTVTFATSLNLSLSASFTLGLSAIRMLTSLSDIPPSFSTLRS